MTYGVLKSSIFKGYVSCMKLSSGYTLERARDKCKELNRLQEKKNTDRLKVFYVIQKDSDL